MPADADAGPAFQRARPSPLTAKDKAALFAPSPPLLPTTSSGEITPTELPPQSAPPAPVPSTTTTRAAAGEPEVVGEPELRCVIAVVRHGDRTPKQKMKMQVADSVYSAVSTDA
jgi:inositol hexakisphosphate/diphosphoinositol-pentakisphosphate kinase